MKHPGKRRREKDDEHDVDQLGRSRKSEIRSGMIENGPAAPNGILKANIPSIPSGLSNLGSLYSISVFAKIWGVAQKHLVQAEPPRLYPEYTKPGGVSYVYRDLEFWTSGFFPGSLHVLLERQRKWNHLLSLTQSEPQKQMPHPLQFEFACKWWTENLHQNADLAGTHDLGFMICPWARLQWELNHDRKAFDTIGRAAKMLASRYSETVGCLRSWDTCQTKAYSFTELDTDFLVIIDNMMNLDLLFFVAAHTNSPSLYEKAVAHAKTTQRAHIRPDFSTTHLVVFDPASGAIKSCLTNQGRAHDSCWSRGQAWAIAGFAQTYKWTGDPSFLETARKCVDYFVAHLPESMIPPWDFAAVEGDGASVSQQPTDTSAAVIAAYGMLLVHEALVARGTPSTYLASALRIADAVCARHLNHPARFVMRGEEFETVEHGVGVGGGSVLEVEMGLGDTILNGATINNYEFAPRRWANHGLVYADYFFLLLGNKLLEMGIGELVIRAAGE